MSSDDQHGIELTQSPMIERERAESETERRRFDLKRYIPSALRAPDKTQPPAVIVNARFSTMKKTAMTLLCLLIIIMSNSVQLKHVLKQGSSHPFYSTQVFLGIISVLMCACIGFAQMYTDLFVQVDDQASSAMEHCTRSDQLRIILPMIFLFTSFLLNIIFLILMLKF